jgi:hypothetical protein
MDRWPEDRPVTPSAQIVGTLALALVSLSCTENNTGPRVGTVPARITLISGLPSGSYVAGTRIATPIVVKVTDYQGLAVPDERLSFSGVGGGSVTPDLVVTDANGNAQFYWNLGTAAGTNSLMISVAAAPGISPVEITTTTIPVTVAFLFMDPHAATIAQGSTLQLIAREEDANFNDVAGVPISWASSNPAALSVSSSGLLTAVAPGYAIIGATANKATASSIVTVPVPAGPSGPGIPPFTMAVSAAQDYGISIVRSDGTLESRIACGTQCALLAGPNWSRDGSKLSFTGRRDFVSVLFVANRDGSDLHEVASAPGWTVSLDKSSLTYWPEFNEDWSTDGRLVYIRATQTGNSIETVAADGTGRTTVMSPAGSGPGNPQWGPGDSMITAEIGGQIYSMNPDGSNLHQLTSTTAGAFNHRWSPDGKSIAFFSDPSFDQGIISILDPLSGALRQIIVSRMRSFCWSPNSSQLSFVSLENELQGWQSIYTVNVDGTGLQRSVIGIMDMDNSASAWSPDGGFLVYMDDRRFTGGPAFGQIYAQSVNQGTNTKLSDMRNVIFLSIAGARGCERFFAYP